MQLTLGLIRPAEQSTRCASAEALDSLSPVAIKSPLGLYTLDTSYEHTGEAQAGCPLLLFAPLASPSSLLRSQQQQQQQSVQQSREKFISPRRR